jgi:hypothetical protein
MLLAFDESSFSFAARWRLNQPAQHSKSHLADLTSAKTYSPRLSKSTKSKILLILVIDCLISRSEIDENARLQFGVFMLKSVPSGRGLESRSKKTYADGVNDFTLILRTKNVKSATWFF